MMDFPELLIDTWTIDCFEIKGAKTFVEFWVDYIFKRDGDFQRVHYQKGMPYLDKVKRHLEIKEGYIILMEEGKETFTVARLTIITLTLVNPQRNLIYYCKRKSDKNVLQI